MAGATTGYTGAAYVYDAPAVVSSPGTAATDARGPVGTGSGVLGRLGVLQDRLTLRPALQQSPVWSERDAQQQPD